MSLTQVQYRTTGNWNQAIPTFTTMVQNAGQAQNIVSLSATLGNSDDSCILLGYVSNNPVNPNWAGLTLMFTTVRTNSSWNDTYPQIQLALLDIPFQNVVSVSILQTPTSHSDCLAIIWYVQ